MWTVDQIKVRNGVVYFAFTKIGRFVQNPPEEIYILSSHNLLTVRFHAFFRRFSGVFQAFFMRSSIPCWQEPDASKVAWKLLPDGDHGIAGKYTHLHRDR